MPLLNFAQDSTINGRPVSLSGMVTGDTPGGISVTVADVDSYIAQQESQDAVSLGSGLSFGPSSVSDAQSGYATDAQRYCVSYPFACAGFDVNSVAQKYAQKLAQDVAAQDAAHPSVNYLTGWAQFLQNSGLPYAQPQSGGLLNPGVSTPNPAQNALQTSAPQTLVVNPQNTFSALIPPITRPTVSAPSVSATQNVQGNPILATSGGGGLVPVGSVLQSSGDVAQPAQSSSGVSSDFTQFTNDLSAGNYEQAFFTDTIAGIPVAGLVAVAALAVWLLTKGKR